MNRIRRTIFLVDREVQGALMLRMIVYWLFCLLSICLMLICWNAYTGPSRRFIDLTTELYFRYAPALSATLILLPIMLWITSEITRRSRVLFRNVQRNLGTLNASMEENITGLQESL